MEEFTGCTTELVCSVTHSPWLLHLSPSPKESSIGCLLPSYLPHQPLQTDFPLPGPQKGSLRSPIKCVSLCDSVWWAYLYLPSLGQVTGLIHPFLLEIISSLPFPDTIFSWQSFCLAPLSNYILKILIFLLNSHPNNEWLIHDWRSELRLTLNFSQMFTELFWSL